jgi:hypothetical protein
VRQWFNSIRWHHILDKYLKQETFMTWSKATVITWATIADQIGNETLNEERIDFIANAVTNNKTDGLYVMINETTTKRAWLNQAAAEEYKQFILTDTARLGITIPTVEIIDNVA